MGVLFLVPNPGCSGAENELLLSLVLFFCILLSAPCLCCDGIRGRGGRGAANSREKTEIVLSNLARISAELG